MTDPHPGHPRVVKCLVWDLDHTLWDGSLLEDGVVDLRPGVRAVLEALDERGVLQSIASRTDHTAARRRLAELGVDHYFLHPQISSGAKAAGVAAIAAALDVALDAIAFIDDQPFERDEVRFSHPEVLCLDAADVHDLLERPELKPPFVTDEARQRRRLYQSEIDRRAAEVSFDGSGDEFLATLGIVLRIGPARQDDLLRAEELTRRTHQLNATGRAYSHEELQALRCSPGHRLLVAELEDRYGTYGKIGLGLIELAEDRWTISLFLLSCRTASRGVGSVFLGLVAAQAQSAGVRLLAELVENERNRAMYVTYRFNGFREIARQGSHVLLENDLRHVAPPPPHMKIEWLTEGE